MALRLPFPFRQAQYVQAFLLKPVTFFKLSTSLGSTYKSTISPFLFTHSRSVLSYVFLFYLRLSGRSGRNCLLSPRLLSGYNGSNLLSFFLEKTRLMSWQAYSSLLQALIVSLLLPFVSTHLSFQTGGAPSHLNSLTHRSPRGPLKNLCFLVTLDVFLSSTLKRAQRSFKLLCL